MKKMLPSLGLMFFSASLAHAQTGANAGGSKLLETQSSPISSVLIEPAQQVPIKDLPDAPIPVLPQKVDGPMPCPLGVGAPCALLGGRLYFSDPSHMTEHDKTLWAALKNPMIAGAIAVNIGADVWDYRTAFAHLGQKGFKETNPIMGQSRAQMLAVGISLDAIMYFSAARLKERGKGNYAFMVLAGNSVLHVYAAANNRSLRPQ